jgi:hypothetical protein
MKLKSSYIIIGIILVLLIGGFLIYSFGGTEQAIARLRQTRADCLDRKERYVDDRNIDRLYCSSCFIITLEQIDCILHNCDRANILDECLLDIEDRDEEFIEEGDKWFFWCEYKDNINPIDAKNVELRSWIIQECIKDYSYDVSTFCRKQHNECGSSKCVGFKRVTYGCHNTELRCQETIHEPQVGQCGVECLTSTDCPQSGDSCRTYKCVPCIEGELTCKGDDVYECQQGALNKVKECGYGCVDGSCNTNPMYLWVFVILIIFIIGGISLFIVIKFRRK